MLLFPQFAAPTLRHFTSAPDAYAEGQTLYLDFTFVLQASSSTYSSVATFITLPFLSGFGSSLLFLSATLSYTETNNFIKLPDHVIGVNNVFKIDSSTISSGLFNIKYQLFLNDLYYYGALDLLNYAMVKTYLEDLSRLITPDIQIRFNKKNT